MKVLHYDIKFIQSVSVELIVISATEHNLTFGGIYFIPFIRVSFTTVFWGFMVG